MKDDPANSSQAILERLTRLHNRPIDLSLDRMRRLCEALGDPHKRLPPVVHVAGTNGKGSTLAFLRAIAEAEGLRAHVYTSPHLVRFAERVRLAGALIDDDSFARLLARVERINDNRPITQFEATTAAAFLAFAEVAADICLVEVGLGGRYDATNVIDQPALCIITPVARDHCEFLGETLPEIAGEKAGVIKSGAPVISAAQSREALQVIERAAMHAHVPLVLAGRDFHVAGHEGGMKFTDAGGHLSLPAPVLAGEHQIRNAGVAIAAARRLGLSAPAIARGLSEAVWPARLQRIEHGPLSDRARAAGAELWLDGAHNPHAFESLVPVLDRMRLSSGRPVCVILGLLARKDAEGVMDALRPLAPFHLIVTDFSAPAAAPAESLAELARQAGLGADHAPSLTEALALALAKGPPSPLPSSPLIVICGSLSLAGEVLGMSKQSWPA